MKIKTSLLTRSTDEQGCIDKFNHGAFAGVFNLGLLVGSDSVETGCYPTDDKGLKDLKQSLDELTYKSLAGLSGIGAVIGVANPRDLSEEDMINLSIAIQNIADLGLEAQSHIEGIEMDMNKRNKGNISIKDLPL